MAEKLYDCPACGRKNFTKKGLSAHQCRAEKPAKGVRTITLGDLEVMPEAGPLAIVAPKDPFALVNEYHELARLSMAQSCAYMILAGAELIALKNLAEHGEWEKCFPPKDGTKSAHACAFEMSLRTAQKYMRFATEAKKRIPALREGFTSSVPLSQWEPEKRLALVKAVSKVGDGSTYKDLALEWGIAKKPPGGPGGDNNPRNGKKEDPDVIADRAAQETYHPIFMKLFAARSEEADGLLRLPIATDTPDKVASLTHLEGELKAMLDLVRAALAKRKKGPNAK